MNECHHKHSNKANKPAQPEGTIDFKSPIINLFLNAANKYYREEYRAKPIYHIRAAMKQALEPVIKIMYRTNESHHYNRYIKQHAAHPAANGGGDGFNQIY